MRTGRPTAQGRGSRAERKGNVNMRGRAQPGESKLFLYYSRADQLRERGTDLDCAAQIRCPAAVNPCGGEAGQHGSAPPLICPDITTR